MWDAAPHVNRRAVFRLVLGNPRLRLIVGDGRNHLRLTAKRYDAIISEPSNPWMAGVSSLFTRDFFRLARERLAPGGLFCQWAHVYNLSRADLETVVASFTDAFPHAAIKLFNSPTTSFEAATYGKIMRVAPAAR